MDFLALAKERRSVYQYSDKAVPEDDLMYALEAARWSPSCNNIQPWNFIVVRSPELVEKLIACCRSAAKVAAPPQLVACVLDTSFISKSAICASQPEQGRVDAYVSIGTAALNMAYAAQVKGWDSGFMTPDPVKADALLALPPVQHTVILVLLGKEKAGAPQKRKERNPLGELVRYR